MKYSEIRDLYEDLFKNNENAMAYITHYLQLKNSNDSKHFKAEASKYINTDMFNYEYKKIIWDIPFPQPKKPKFTFIDLFAGIGGFRIAMQKLGGKCVFSSEWDRYCKITYERNFGEVPFGDITQIDEKNIPDHDILCGGFPCQAFSIAGKRKGFNDTRGTLFFDIARILSDKKPKAFILENVKGLVNHDKGRTLEIILETLRDDLKYFVPDPIVLNAKNYGVPQNRERIIIVGFRKDVNINSFSYPRSLNKNPMVKDIIENHPVSVKYYLSTTYWESMIKHKARHEAKGHGFGYEIIPHDKTANAVVVGGMGRERNLIIDKRLKDFTPITNIKGQVNKDGIRRMTPREWSRLQGFPDNFIIPVSDAQAYRQFGNAVPVPLVYYVGRKVINKIIGG